MELKPVMPVLPDSTQEGGPETGSAPPPPTPCQAVLAPSYRLPLGLGAIALGLAWLNLWWGLGIGLFAVFLAIQAATLRVHFTAEALDLYRGEQRLRHFPYADWLHWEIFWQPCPILFYFKEVNSIHFLPILFDPSQLRDCATANCSHLSGNTPKSD